MRWLELLPRKLSPSYILLRISRSWVSTNHARHDERFPRELSVFTKLFLFRSRFYPVRGSRFPRSLGRKISEDIVGLRMNPERRTVSGSQLVSRSVESRFRDLRCRFVRLESRSVKFPSRNTIRCTRCFHVCKNIHVEYSLCGRIREHSRTFVYRFLNERVPSLRRLSTILRRLNRKVSASMKDSRDSSRPERNRMEEHRGR